MRDAPDTEGAERSRGGPGTELAVEASAPGFWLVRTGDDERGWVVGPATAAFLAAGYSPQQALDVILGVTMKTLSNYVNHLTETPVNEQFASETWSRRDAA